MQAGVRMSFYVCLVWACVAGAGRSADLTEAQLRDGLGRLAALVGGEVPKNARWVLVSSEQGRVGIFAQQEDVFRAEGNAFLLDEKPGREARVMPVFDGAVYLVKTQPDEEAQSSGNGRHLPPVLNAFQGAWKDADAAKDVATAVEWLRKQAKSAAKAAAQPSPDPFSSSMRMSGSDPAAEFAAQQQTALFWASLLLHTGQEAPALSLAAAALEGADEKRRKSLLDSFFDRLGQRAFNKALTSFSKHHDWASLRDELDRVVKQFPLGWQSRDAARVLLHHVTERAQLPAEPPLVTKGVQLAEEEQKTILAWLKEMEEGRHPQRGGIWTLPPAPQAEDEEEEEAEEPADPAEASRFPRSHGLAAVPLLAALLADQTLIRVGFHDGEGAFASQMMRYSSFSLGRGGNPADSLRQAYASLHKPPTRASVVWSVLQEVLPQDLQGADSDNLTESIPEILAWHASVKNLPPAELALSYLEAGQRDPALLAHAMKVEDPKKLARLEDAMLEQVNVWDTENLIPFVEKLGPEKASAFIGKVRQKFEADLGRFGSDDKDMRKQMENGLKRLEAAARGEKKTFDLPAILAAFASYDLQTRDNEVDVREAYQAFPRVVKRLPAPTSIEAVLKALPEFKSPAFAGQLLQMLFGGRGLELPELKPEERRPLLEATKVSWQKLLAAGATSEEPALLVSVVESLNGLVAGPTAYPWGEVAQLGGRGTKLLREHGQALLDGQPPALPDPAAIDDAAREKLLAEWGGKPVADIANGLATLEIDKLLALNQKIARSTELPGGMQAHIAMIREVTVKKGPDPAPWRALKGRSFNREVIVALARQVSEHKGEGVLTIRLYREAPVRGFTLIVEETPELEAGWQSNYMRHAATALDEKVLKKSRRVGALVFRQGRMQANCSWGDAPAFMNEAVEIPPAGQNGETLHNWEVLVKAVETPTAAAVTLFCTSAPAVLLKSDE